MTTLAWQYWDICPHYWEIKRHYANYMYTLAGTLIACYHLTSHAICPHTLQISSFFLSETYHCSMMLDLFSTRIQLFGICCHWISTSPCCCHFPKLCRRMHTCSLYWFIIIGLFISIVFVLFMSCHVIKKCFNFLLISLSCMHFMFPVSLGNHLFCRFFRSFFWKLFLHFSFHISLVYFVLHTVFLTIPCHSKSRPNLSSFSYCLGIFCGLLCAQIVLSLTL